LGCEVGVVSRRGADTTSAYASIAEGLEGCAPGYVVLARETGQHGDDLRELVRQGFRGKVLVEKPLTADPEPFPADAFESAAVGYNLRFHPLLDRLRQHLTGHRVLSVAAYAGQHLAGWRPGTDHRTSYSADVDAGGGVLRDLSHEVDYLLWLFGSWSRVAALGGNSGSLGIDSDDRWAVLLGLRDCPVVSFQVNYLDRVGQRHLTVITEQHTIVVDLVGGAITVDGETEHVVTDRDATYRLQHEAMLFGVRADDLCRLPQGQEVVRLIAAIERSQRDGTWVER
jgi:predicted dehydrogenase